MDDEKPFSSGRWKSGSQKKRSRSQFDNGKQKWRNLNHDHSSVTSKPIDTLYRILCPVKKIGSVLGKGGDIVNALRDETNAKIRVADAIPGAEERVIIIFSYSSTSKEYGKIDSDMDDGPSENEYVDMRPHCPAQNALLKVHERIIADEYVRGGVVHEKAGEDDGDDVIARILVPSNQVGCLLGKGGTVIQKLRSETGASIRVLPTEHLPPCAMSTDELVQVSGRPPVVKNALYEVSTLLHQHPRKENPPLEELVYASTQGSHRSGPSMQPPVLQGNPGWPHKRPVLADPPPLPWFGGYRNESAEYASGGYQGRRAGNSEEMVEEFSMRIFCPAEKIGGVIGKAGANVRQLEQQTRARIQVEDMGAEADERVILVSSTEAYWDPQSPTIDAVLQLQNKVCTTSEKGTLTTRLLVPSSKVGCLLGQGGNVITEMRMRTRADIRVYSKDDKPKYTPANEELVQISGNHDVAREALIEIASRLRDRTLRGSSTVLDPLSHRSLHSFAPSENFSGRGVPSSAMVGHKSTIDYEYSKRGSAQVHEAHRYPGPLTASRYPVPVSADWFSEPANAAVYSGPASAAGYSGPASAAGYIGSASAAGYHGSISGAGYSRPTGAPGYTGPAGIAGYNASPTASGYYSAPLATGYHGPPSATGHANVNGSVEIMIPNSAVPAVLGAGGSNISEIRQISGARVKLHDPLSGASECVVEIHGSSDQMKAAQSLLQAFIASGGQNAHPPAHASRPY